MKAKRLTKGQLKQLRFRNAKLLPQSRSVYSAAVRSYFVFLLDNGLSDEFNLENIEKWLSGYRNACTFNVRLQGIKEFYFKQYEGKSAVRRLQVREALETIRRKHPSVAQLKGIDYLTRVEVERMAERMTQRASCLVMALFWTGCRISELINIHVNDCIEGDPILIRVMGKGLKERYVYLPRREYKRIRIVFSGRTFLFENMTGEQMSRCFVSHEIHRQALAKSGLSVHAHTLRHSKAMYLKDRGMSTDQIARALGHANVTTTLAYYLHGTPGAKEQGIPVGKKWEDER